MLRESYPCYLAGEAVAPNLDLEVTDKFTGEVATRVPLVGEAEIDRAADFCADHLPSAPFVLQPVTEVVAGGPAAPSGADLLRLHEAASRRHPDVRVLPQVHRALGLR